MFDFLASHLFSVTDGLFVAFTIDWVSSALLTGQSIWAAPLFYPQTHALAFSQPFFTSGVINLIFKLFSDNIILNSNLLFLLFTLLNFISSFFLAKLLFKSNLLAIFTAILFAFSPLLLFFKIHLHIYLLWGINFSLYFFLKFIKIEKKINLSWAAFFFLAQALNNPETAYFLGFIYAIFLFSRKVRLVLRKNWQFILLVGLLTFLTLFIFYWPYWQVSQQLNFKRSIRDAAHFSAGLEKLLDPNILFFSFLVMFLFKKQKNKFTYQNIFLAITVLGLIMMLGPVVKINQHTLKIFSLPIPLPYTIFYYLIPGFNAFRASARWIVLFIFGSSFYLGYLLKKSNNKQILALLTLVLIFNIYQIIKNRPETSLLELPVFSLADPLVEKESYRLYYQRYHSKKLINGYSGFAPSLQMEQAELVLVNTDLYHDQIDKKLVTCQENYCLYQR